jgi:hypothetical protein
MSDHRISQVRVERLENATENGERGSTQKAGTAKEGPVAQVHLGRDAGKSEG